MKKVAVYCGTRAIYQDMEMSAKSLYANSDVDTIWFLCEDDKWPNKLPSFIKVKNVSNQEFFPPDGPNMKTQFTYMAMIRAALCKIFPRTNIILSLDADIIVEKDCSDIWDIDVSDVYLAATPEPQFCHKGLIYMNTGVALYNLEKLRDGKADEVIHALNVQRFPNVEQDALSYLCQGNFVIMPGRYNWNYYTTGFRGDVVLRHFAGYSRSEWMNGSYARKWRAMSWEEAIDLHNSLKAAKKSKK